jgi:hypothetical protein
MVSGSVSVTKCHHLFTILYISTMEMTLSAVRTVFIDLPRRRWLLAMKPIGLLMPTPTHLPGTQAYLPAS